jgi:hypothetical protein
MGHSSGFTSAFNGKTIMNHVDSNFTLELGFVKKCSAFFNRA